MRNEEALVIATRVSTAFPRPDWNDDRIALFAEAIVDLPYDLAVQATRDWQRTQSFQPSAANIRELVNKAIERRQQKQLTDERSSGAPVDRDEGLRILGELRRKLERKRGARTAGLESLGAIVGSAK